MDCKAIRQMALDAAKGMKPGDVWHVSLSELVAGFTDHVEASDGKTDPAGDAIAARRAFAKEIGEGYTVKLVATNTAVARVERIA